MKKLIQTRREFLGTAALGAALVTIVQACQLDTVAESAPKDKLEVLRANGVQDPNSEWSGARDVPDDVRWKTSMSGMSYEVDSDEAEWNSEKVYEDGNIGHRPGLKGGYFPVPPVDSLNDLRAAMCLAMEEMGLEVEVHHHEVATAGQCEIGTAFNTLTKRAD